MQKELLNQAMQMFDSSDKWNSFLELSSSKDEIRNQWYHKLKIQVTKRFLEEDVVKGWSFTTWNQWDYRWYLTEFGKESFCIWMYGNCIGLWANPNLFNSQKITELLNTDTYSIIMSVLRPDTVFPNDWKLAEYGNFDFESPFTGHFDNDKLAWFAGNESEKFSDQLSEKVNKIRKNEIITGLFADLNREAKK